MKKYGYVRVSTKEQNLSRQLAAMNEMLIEEKNIFMDRQSGKDFERPMYKLLVSVLKPDDIVYVKSIDRLGRNYKDIIAQWKVITQEKKADIVVIDMPILDTRRGKDLMGTFLTDIVLALLSYVAENERANILARQSEGIAAAKIRGVKFGAPKSKLPKSFTGLAEKWRLGQITVRDAARKCGIPKSTFYDRAVENTKDEKMPTFT